MPGNLELLSSGMLRPKKSMLAVFGLTKRVDLPKRLIELIPCHNSSYAPCAYRRAPYQVPDHRFKVKPGATRSSAGNGNGTETASPLSHDASYAFDTTVLERWCKERMEITTGEDGITRACFHFKGNTCTNMGEELAFDYHMKLGAAGDQYRIIEAACIPAEEHEGYKKMCSYVEKGEEALAPVKEERALVGMPLDEVVKWDPMIVPAGCLCSISNRNHKWRIVLQSLHYWMAQHEAKSLGNF